MKNGNFPITYYLDGLQKQIYHNIRPPFKNNFMGCTSCGDDPRFAVIRCSICGGSYEIDKRDADIFNHLTKYHETN